MFFVCWSVKGGVGTSVVAAALAVMSAESGEQTLLVDLDGDQPSILGLPTPVGAGIIDWLGASDEVPVDVLAELEVEVNPNLALLPRGEDSIAEPARLALLGSLLAGSGRAVVVDAGPTSSSRWWTGRAESVLVIRSCYLALHRVGHVPADTRLVLVEEPGRALRVDDVVAATGVSTCCRVMCDPAVARAVDAGLLPSRLPRALRPLGRLR